MTVLTNTGQEEKNSLAFLPPVQPDLLLDNFPAWWSGSTEKKHLGKHVPQLQGIKKCLLEKCSLSNLEEPIMKLWLLYLFVSRIRCTPPSSTDCSERMAGSRAAKSSFVSSLICLLIWVQLHVQESRDQKPLYVKKKSLIEKQISNICFHSIPERSEIPKVTLETSEGKKGGAEWNKSHFG